MKWVLFSLALTVSSYSATLVDAHVQRVQSLVAAHRAAISRLNSPASASANNLSAGGAFYLCCGDNAWIAEASGRAGSAMGITVLTTQRPGAKDVVWVSYTAGTYQAAVTAISQLSIPSGGIVVWFGPRPPSGPPAGAGVYWLDSLTSWSDDDDFTLTGNVLSLWSLTGELAAAAAQQGKTLVFQQNIEFPGATTRNAHYTNQLFHTGLPRASTSIAAGALSGGYLDAISTLTGQIAQSELAKITATGQTMTQKAAAGTPVLLITDSRLATYSAKAGSPYYRYLADPATLAGALPANNYLVYLGSYGLDLESYRTVRNAAGAHATWIVGPVPHQADPAYYSDTLIDQHWDLDEAVVNIPGYDIPVLPPSGFAQLFVYDLLLRAAMSAAGPPTVSITSPASGASVSGSNVTVSAAASAGTGLTIANVQFKVDNANQGAPATSSPYSVVLDTTKLTNGSHALTAVATDSAGNAVTSGVVTVTVNNVGTTVAITAPAAGANVSGASLTVTAAATAGSGLTISNVQFKVDNANQGAAVTASPYSVVVDTTKLTNGTHTLTAVATDSASNAVTSSVVSVTVNNPPTAAITAPAAGASVSGNLTVSATAAAALGATIANVQFKVDNVNQGAAVTASPYSVVVDTTKLTNGTHTLTAVATDSGNISTASAPISVTVNNVGTTVAITAPAAGASVSGANVSVTATATAGSGLTITNVQFKVDNANQGAAVTASPYSVVVDTTKLTNGTHTLTAVATDSGSNTVTSSIVNVTVNNAPSVAITAPVAGASVSGNLTMSATATAALGATIANVQFKVDNANQGAAVTASPYSVVVDTTKLTNGTHTLTAVATDSGSNAATSAVVSVTVNNPPTAAITAPVAGASVSGNLTVSATATAALGATIANVQFKVDNANQGGAVTASPYSVIVDTTKLTNGTHTLTAVATDSGGNPVTSAPVSVTVNNPPTVAITAPAAGASVSGNLTVSATAAAAGGATVANVQFKVDNVNQGAPVTSSPYSIVVDTTKLSNGSHTLTAVATDSANNSATSAPISVTVNNVGTTVAITAPPAGASVSSNVTVSATATAGSGLTIANVQFKVDNANQGAPVTASPYGIVLDTTKLTNGTHSLTAVATDSGNNAVTSPIVSVTVNNPPSVAITAPAAGASVSGNLTVSASASAALGATIANVQFKVDNVNQGAPVTSSPYSVLVDTTKLGNGSHTLTAVATDSANISATSAPMSVTVNNVGTTVAITAPAAGASVSSNVTVSATATAGSGLTIANVQFKVDNANQGAPVTASPYGIVLDTTKLTNGTHSLTAVATDSGNNAVTSPVVSVTVNNPPSVAITAPASGASVSGNLTVSATASAGLGATIANVQFKVDNANQGAPVTSSPYSIVVDTTKLTNGTHTLTAVATDSGSNAVTSTVVSVTVKNTPTIAITAPVAGTSVSGNLTVSATAAAALGATIANVQFKVDNANQGAAVTSSPYSTVVDTTKLSNGSHTFTAVANDSGNNSTTSAPISVTVNNVGTTVAITAPAAGASVSSTVTVAATATAGSGLTITNVQFKVDNANQGAPVTSSPYSIVLDTAKLTNGTHTLTAVATDSGSNVITSAVVSITVNNPPSVAITAPAAGASVSGNLTVSATVAAALGSTVANVQFKVDNLNQGAAATSSPYSIVVDTTKLSNGSHTVTAVATDSASNATTSAPISVTVNNVATTVAITAPAAGASVSSNVTVSATATAGSGLTVTNVQFKVDNANQGAPVTNSPYSIVLDTTKLTNGTHTLSAVAADSGNNTVSSPAVSMTVNNPPGVSITAPSGGASVSGNMTVSATAAAALGATIANVQFKVDNVNQGSPVASAPYSIVVDTTKLSNGSHTLTAVATDSANNVTTSASVGITVGNTATSVAITTPASGATISGSSVTVSAAASAGSGVTVTSVQFKVDNANQGGPVTASPYSIVLDTTKLANGTHTLTAAALDSANNTVTSPASTITVNNTLGPPPAVLVTGFTPGTLRNNFTGGVGLQFTVGSTPITVTALGRLFIAGNTGSHLVRLVNASDGSDVAGGSVTITLPSGTAGQFAYVPLAAALTLSAGGSYYLVSQETLGGDQWYDIIPVTAASAAAINGSVYWNGFRWIPIKSANSSYVPVSLQYSSGAPPTVSITAPTPGAALSGNNVPFSASATPASGLTIAGVQFKVDGVNWGPAVTAAPYSTTLDATKLSNGTHVLTATAIDSAGTSGTSGAVSVTVNNPAPTVSITAPSPGSTVSGNTTVTVSAVAGSGLSIASVQLLVDNSAQGAPATVSPYNISLDTTTLANGTHGLTAVATDSAGNTTMSSAVFVTVGNTGSTVAISAPAAGSTVSGSNVNVSATATPGSGLTISSVQFKVDNANQGPPDTTYPYGIVLDATKLINGSHTLLAVATDSGNKVVTSPPVSITVANPVPTVSISSPVPGASVSGTATLTAAAAAGSGLTIASVQFKVDNANQGAPVTASPYSTTLDTRALSNGTHTLTAVATDSAANSTTSAGVSVTVANSSTTVTITTPAAGASLSGKNVNVTATATPATGQTITSVQFLVDNANQGAPVTASPYTIVLDTTKFINGAHSLTAVAADSAGGSTPSAAVSVTVANPPPTVSLTGPAAGATLSGTATATATATGGAGLTIASVQFKVDAVNQGAAATTSPYSVSFDSRALSNGSHSLTAVATDSAGNSTTSSPVAVTVSNASASGAFLTAFTPGAVRNNYSGWVGMQFTVGPAQLTVTALGRIYVAGNNSSHIVRLVRASDSIDVPGGSVTINYPSGTAGQFTYVQLGSAVTLAANTSYYLASQEAASGDQWYNIGPVTPSSAATVNGPAYYDGVKMVGLANPNSSYVPVNLLYTGGGAQPPSVAVTSPASGAAVSGNNVSVSASATAATGLTISSVQFKLDNANQGAPISVSPYNIVLDATKIVNGGHTLTAVATDSAGASSASSPVSITVSNPAPAVSITAPAAGATVSGTSVSLAAAASAGSGLTLANVQFRIDGSNAGPAITLSPYTTTIDATKLSNGAHSLTAVATDSAGNTTISTAVTFNVSGGSSAATPLITGFSPGPARNNYTGWVGMQFTVGASAMSVSALGRVYVSGNTGSHVVKLVRASDNSDVPGGSISVPVASGSPGLFTYAQLASPVTLAANTTYNLVSAETSGGDQWYDIGPVNSTSAVSVGAAVYWNNSTYVPAATGGVSYVPLSLQYAPPAGSSYTPPPGIPLITGHILTQPRNNFSGWSGMQFTVGCAPINAGALGRIYIAGNTGTHAVKLVRASDGADVPGGATAISLPQGTPGQFIYGQLASPVTLQANTTYYLVSQETSGSDQFYDYNGVSAVNVVTVNNGIYWNGTAWTAAPSQSTSFVGVDLLLTIPSAPQTPAAPPASPAPLRIATPQAAGMNHFLITGQSLATGYNGGPPLTLTQPFSNLMLNSGYTALIPLVEGNQAQNGAVETIGSGMGNTLTSLSPGKSYVDVVTNDGRNGFAYSQLAKGTPPYADGITQLTKANNLAQAQGKTYKVGGIAVVHGEADQAGSPAPSVYEGYLVQWQRDYQTDVKAIAQQTDSVPFFIDQMSSWTYMLAAVPTVPIGQLAASEDQPGAIYLVGPKYQYRYSDGLHLEKFSYRQQGEQFGKVIKKVLVDGVQWRPLTPYLLNRSGNVVTAQFYVPAPPLRFDTATVVAKSAMGFEYSDGTACSPYITNVQIISPDTVALTLSGLPNGSNERLRYAYTGVPNSGAGADQTGSARGNLKDSDATPSLYGNDLSNWAVTFDKPVSHP